MNILSLYSGDSPQRWNYWVLFYRSLSMYLTQWRCVGFFCWLNLPPYYLLWLQGVTRWHSLCNLWELFQPVLLLQSSSIFINKKENWDQNKTFNVTSIDFAPSYLLFETDLCDYFVSIHTHHRNRAIRNASCTIGWRLPLKIWQISLIAII